MDMGNVPIEHVSPSSQITEARVEASMMLFAAPLLESIAKNENDLQEIIDLRNAMIDNGYRAARCLRTDTHEAERRKYSFYARIFFESREALRDLLEERGKVNIDTNVK